MNSPEKKETLSIVSYATKNPDRRRELRAGIQRVLADREFRLEFPEDDTFAAACLRGADILLAWQITEPLFRAAGRLRWIHIGNAGVDKSLFPALVASDVVLTNVSGIHGAPMAEWVLGALLYIGQRFDVAERWRARRQWREPKERMTRERFLITGKRALIVGYGAVGRAIAERLAAHGVTCEAVASASRSAPLPLHPVSALPEIIGDFDVVVLALPLTSATVNLFDANLLRRMRAGSIFVNVARGQIVDEAALIDCLRHGPLAWAALDVFRTEPLPPDSPLFDLPNVFLTPHISGNFPDYTRLVHDAFLDNLACFAAGRPLQNVVDKVRGY